MSSVFEKADTASIVQCRLAIIGQEKGDVSHRSLPSEAQIKTPVGIIIDF